jgi:hypothetical protein
LSISVVKEAGSMVYYDEHGAPHVKFDIVGPTTDHQVKEFDMPLELYILCAKDTYTLEALRMRLFEVQHELNDARGAQAKREALSQTYAAVKKRESRARAAEAGVR